MEALNSSSHQNLHSKNNFNKCHFQFWFFIESHSPAPTPEPSILKSVGRKHPLSSTGYENEMSSTVSGVSGGEIDLDEMSNDEVLMEDSLKAGQFDLI